MLVRWTLEFETWIDGLRDRPARAVIDARIARLREGNFGQTRSVEHGLSELKIDYGPGFRVYFTRRGDVIVVLLCGGDKSTQSRDIERAKRLLIELET